jgi:hypothetical protein
MPALVVLLTTIGALLTFAPPASAAPGESQVPIPNPDLDAACGIDILVILDRSTSIANAGATNDVKTAFRAFTAALKNTGSRMAVADFSSVARLPLPGAASRQYTTVTDATIASTFEPYINGFTPNGRTHWEDGFRVGRFFLPRPTQDIPHLTLFITDGNPNQVVREDRVTPQEYQTVVPLAESDQAQANNNDATARAVPNANALKTTGSHILAVAVGDGLSGNDTLQRLIAISDDDVFPDTGPFDISTTDIYRQEDFSLLQEALREAAFQLCAPSVNVHKLVDQNPDPAVEDLQPGVGWNMDATVSPTPDTWVLPPGASGPTATGTTGADGFVNFQWTTATPIDSTITVTEEAQPGFANDPDATTCSYITPDVQDPTPMPGFSATDGGFSGTVPADSIVTCEMVNRVVPEPAIDIEKATNGHDSDTPPGALIPIGSDITWTYVVTNTGNVPLSGLAVVDDVIGPIDCPATTLTVGGSVTCTATGTAVAGQYTNNATATAVDGFGTEVTDADPSNYLGVTPGIDIEKAINAEDPANPTPEEDADLPPGPFLPVDAAITWTYVVTNNGDTDLNDVVVTDDQIGAITCPATTLAIGASMTCTATGTAEAGAYENVGSVSGTSATDPTVIVQDSDPAHYFGAAPAIELVKTVNGDDANDPPGVQVAIGSPVVFRFTFTNTGNVPLVWSLDDPQFDAVACPRILLLLPGRSLTCFAGAAAGAGQQTNTATVTGDPPGDLVPSVSDDDPANYFGIESGIDIVKSTNGDDANDAPGPFIPVGGAVTWTYLVTNTGNSDLTDVEVVDSRGVAVSCPATTLAIGASMECTATGTAQTDQYSNLSLVTAVDPLGNTVDDVDPSHYFGAEPGINLQKYTNGVDADEAPGPFIPVGDPVEWTFVVTNSGNSTLNQVQVEDSQLGPIDCPADTLAPGDVMTCTATGTATIDQYANDGTVGAVDAQTGQPVGDGDPSHYFGTVSAIALQKLADGDDANTPPGITVPEGSDVTMTFIVTNPGNVPIKNVVLTDDRGLVPTFVGGDTNGDGNLDPGETWTYEATAGPASVDNLNNTGTVTGIDLLENPLTASDPANVTTPGTSPTIPKTGSEAAPLLFIGLSLVVAGTGLSLGGRRARRRAVP